MNIKYVVYTAISNNLGDNAQAYAIYQFLLGMNIPEMDIVVVNRNNILQKIEPNAAYIMPCSMSAVNYYDIIEYLLTAGYGDQFIFLPLSIGLIRNAFGDEDHFKKADWLSKKFVQPIGCRDFDSCFMYRKQGYSAYVYGCITSTLPKRPDGQYDKVYFYDIPNSLYQYIPDNIKEGAISLSKRVDMRLDPERLWNLCVERYELLRDTARLVVTMDYHVATPCVAMGIPVIMVDNCANSGFKWSNDTRLPGLNPKIKYYTKDQWKEIDWEPKAESFEDDKAVMLELASTRVRNAASIAILSNKIEKFLEPTKTRFLDICNKNIEHVDIMGMDEFLGDSYLAKLKTNFKYYLYGLSERYIEQKECVILEYIKRRFPYAEFLGFVDSKKTGTYFGKEVLSPNQMIIDDDTYCLVSAYSANEFVKRLFEEKQFDKSHLWEMAEGTLFYIYHL